MNEISPPTVNELGQQGWIGEEYFSAGLFDVLPRHIAVDILSLLDRPLAVSCVCRTMRLLSLEALEQQNGLRGMTASMFFSSIGIPVHPSSLALLFQFHVDVCALAKKERWEAAQELSLLLDGKVDLLLSPNRLYRFLAHRLLQNSLLAAKYWYGPSGPEPQGDIFFEPIEPFVHWCVAHVTRVLGVWPEYQGGQTVRKGEDLMLPRTRAVRRLVRTIQRKEPVRFLPTLIISDGEPLYDRPERRPRLPMTILSLLPLEVLEQLPFDVISMSIEQAPVIPSSIGSLKEVRFLLIEYCRAKTFPEELGCLPLVALHLDHCLADRLPSSLQGLSTLMFLGVSHCPGLSVDDPVLQALRARGVEVYLS